MRLALMPATLGALAALAGCGGQAEPAGPERKSAAGEVLGGEVSDDMLPLDTVRSTSPADPRAGAPAPTGGSTAATEPKRSGLPPEAQVNGGPELQDQAPEAADAQPPE